jgi:MFS family permease
LVLALGVPLFISSSFLETFTSEETVGLIYTIASIITALALFGALKLLPILGNYKTTLLLVVLETASLIAMSISGSIEWILPAYIIHFVVTTILFFNIDIFLENYTKDSGTGGIRGFAYSLASIAWMCAPFIAGFVVGTDNLYWRAFAVGLLFLIPFGLIIAFALKDFKDPIYRATSLLTDLKSVIKNQDKRWIFLSGFLLKVFFAWMVIYTPIYLHEYIGFNFQEIGIIFAVMMLPYILLEWPIGKLEDKFYGEKEIATN